jgi:hypothetical protein
LILPTEERTEDGVYPLGEEEVVVGLKFCFILYEEAAPVIPIPVANSAVLEEYPEPFR